MMDMFNVNGFRQNGRTKNMLKMNGQMEVLTSGGQKMGKKVLEHNANGEIHWHYYSGKWVQIVGEWKIHGLMNLKNSKKNF